MNHKLRLTYHLPMEISQSIKEGMSRHSLEGTFGRQWLLTYSGI
ncbi:hypothetical protein DOT_2334 [Desulfosporosinus sp. OT]|nr:hypothetical protein DOT_2334 [Desulfosporosinus sp. OT]